MKYIVANWKSNKTISEAQEWIGKLRKANLKIPETTKVILCPSFFHLTIIKKELENQPLSFSLKLGAQNLSPYPEGTYTGEVTARMLSEFVKYVILGHSERRQIFGETNKEIKLKTIQALKNNIIPILAFSNLNQIKASVKDLKQKERKKILLMYEPTNAISKQVGPIGVGQAVSLKKVLPMIKKVKHLFPQNEILYGGSVKSHNIALYLAQSEINGVVSGSASQNAEEFIKMLQLSSQAV